MVNMKIKSLFIIATLSVLSSTVLAQFVSGEEKGGFKKENLFTGGSITLSFSNNGSVLGASPVLGYSITNWLDAGLVFNYIYNSVRHVTYYDQSSGSYYYSDDKLRQSTFGPGAFIKVYPVKFLFLQGQYEHNFIRQKLIYDNGSPSQKYKTDAGSVLVGGGYCSGREGGRNLFYYVSILFDVKKDPNSPYVEETKNGNINVLPIIRAGIQVPLFQGKRSYR